MKLGVEKRANSAIISDGTQGVLMVLIDTDTIVQLCIAIDNYQMVTLLNFELINTVWSK